VRDQFHQLLLALERDGYGIAPHELLFSLQN
jgi:hypothetical protein